MLDHQVLEDHYFFSRTPVFYEVISIITTTNFIKLYHIFLYLMYLVIRLSLSILTYHSILDCT